MEDISLRIDRQTVLFHHAPVREIDRKYTGFRLWSGFGGDAFTGVKYKQDESTTVECAFEQYLKTNRYVKSMDLRNPKAPREEYTSSIRPWAGVSYDELIVFDNIVLKFEEPHVTLKGFNYALPVLHEPWLDFILSIPNKYREGQYLYKEIMLHTFPKEFSWKTKTNLGLPLKASKQRVFINRVKDKVVRVMGVTGANVNYLDFNQKIRNKPDLRNIISLNIHDLKDRNVIDWLDPVKILNTHLAGKGNHADALIVLASLEIHLKTGLKL